MNHVELVEIDVKGGMIEGVKMPKGIRIIVRDFDTEGGDPDAHDLKQCDEGEYYERIYEVE